MTNNNMPKRYSRLQAWAHDTLIGNRALNLHDYILEYGNLLEILAEVRDRRLLDVGCGGGQAAIRMKERYPHLRLTGIDTSVVMIDRARYRARSKGCAIQFEVADVEALPFPDGSFEVVYSFGSAKHWPDPLKGFGECWRVLKPGGELLIADATSDATTQEVENFFDITGFTSLLKKPVVGILSRRMFRLARSVEEYRQIAAELQMPEGTVSHLPDMPAFLFRTRKPLP
jgi:ubiquinone/menaquinone biosynthesis C-methylase UbiE